MAGAVVAVVALLLVVVTVIGSGDDDDEVTLRDETESSTTTSSSAPETSTTETTTETTTTTTIVLETTSTAPPATTTPPPAVVGEERCATGTAEGDAPLTVEACLVDRAAVGDTVVVRIRAHDDDARIRNDCGSPWVDWGESTNDTCTIGCEPSPEPGEPSSLEVTAEHVYAAPGRYPVRVVVESNCAGQPGGAVVSAQLSIEIA